MISNENRQHWRDLKEDFRNCFDGASDLFLTESSELAVNGRLVCRIADRSILKICDALISCEKRKRREDSNGEV